MWRLVTPVPPSGTSVNSPFWAAKVTLAEATLGFDSPRSQVPYSYVTLYRYAPVRTPAAPTAVEGADVGAVRPIAVKTVEPVMRKEPIPLTPNSLFFAFSIRMNALVL